MTLQSPEPAAEQAEWAESRQAESTLGRRQEPNQRKSWLEWILGGRPASPGVQVPAIGTTRSESTPPQIQANSELGIPVLDGKSAKEDSAGCTREDAEDGKDDVKSEKENVTMELQERPLAKSEKADEDKRKRREMYKETFEREDYDSSDYSYPSSGDEEEDMEIFHHIGIFDFNSGDSSGSDSFDEGNEDQDVRFSVSSWTIREWVNLIFCCHRPRLSGTTMIGRSRQETRRERRQRRRIERWRLYQQQQRQLWQEQESEEMPR
ncbi:hypothetical protein BGZ79_001722, partial [Entomortierella chlamydospora]